MPAWDGTGVGTVTKKQGGELNRLRSRIAGARVAMTLRGIEIARSSGRFERDRI